VRRASSLPVATVRISAKARWWTSVACRFIGVRSFGFHHMALKLGPLIRFCAASVVDPAAFADATRFRRWREQFVAAPEDARVSVGERVERAHRREGFVLLDWPVRGAWP
jgi:hypothetical protein